MLVWPSHAAPSPQYAETPLRRAVDAHVSQAGRHVGHGLPRLRAPRPRLEGVAGILEQLRHRADAFAAERVARLARVLDRVDPLFLRLDVFADAVSLVAGAGKL